MKPTIQIALARLLAAAGALLNTIAAEYSGGQPDQAAPAEAPAPKKNTKKAAPAEPATATDVAAEPEAAAESTGEGKTYDELRALIAPVVKDGQGEEVKKIIKKYAGEGGSLKTLEAKHHAAFEKDISALSY